MEGWLQASNQNSIPTIKTNEAPESSTVYTYLDIRRIKETFTDSEPFHSKAVVVSIRKLIMTGRDCAEKSAVEWSNSIGWRMNKLQQTVNRLRVNLTTTADTFCSRKHKHTRLKKSTLKKSHIFFNCLSAWQCLVLGVGFKSDTIYKVCTVDLASRLTDTKRANCFLCTA